MPNSNYDYEYLASIAKTIQILAEVRPYDWYILTVGIVGILFSGVIAGAAAYYAYKLNQKQTKIAETQAKIMEQQNEIALFKKRFEVYCEYKIFIKRVCKASIILNCKNLEDLNSKEAIEKIFDEVLISLFEEYEISSYTNKFNPDLFISIDKHMLFQSVRNMLDAISFIFQFDEKAACELDSLYNAITKLENSFFLTGTGGIKNVREIFHQMVSNFDDSNILSNIKNTLNTQYK